MSAETFQAFESYPYDDDAEFKLGLSSILQHAQNDAQAQDLEKQARSFYFKRKTGQTIDLIEYASWKAAQAGKGKAPVRNGLSDLSKGQEEPSAFENSIASTSVLSTTAGGDDDHVKLSYQQIVDMIKDGKENDLPGVKDIPNTVLDGQGTASTQAARRKPWEQDISTDPVSSTV